jgi:hypothetical protein
MGFLKQEWQVQRPLIRFELYKWGIIAVGGTLITVAAKFLGSLAIRESYLYGGIFVISALVFAWLTQQLRPHEASVVTGQSKQQALPPPKQQGTELASPTSAGQADVEAFYRTYDNALLVEAEDNIRQEAEKYQAGHERERFLVRFFASAYITGAFEYTWVLIFRSQIRAMEGLNKAPRQPVPIESLRPFYDSAILTNPQYYNGYPFTAWLAFMKTYLLIREENGCIAIIVRGHEFLKYLVHTGRTADDKRN